MTRWRNYRCMSKLEAPLYLHYLVSTLTMYISNIPRVFLLPDPSVDLSGLRVGAERKKNQDRMGTVLDAFFPTVALGISDSSDSTDGVLDVIITKKGRINCYR